MRHMTDKRCDMCGLTFSGGPRASYCPTCREERRKQAAAEHRRRKRLGISRKVGDIQTCIDYGKKYEYYIGASERCTKCAEVHGKIIDRQNSQKWKSQNKAAYLKAKKDYSDRQKQKNGPVKTGEQCITFERETGRYRVRIKDKHVGRFNTLEDAIKCRDLYLTKNKK